MSSINQSAAPTILPAPRFIPEVVKIPHSSTPVAAEKPSTDTKAAPVNTHQRSPAPKQTAINLTA